MSVNKRGLAVLRGLLMAVIFTVSQGAFAGVQVGGKAQMFVSIDENINPVDMNDYIDAKPLVLIVSSCT